MTRREAVDPTVAALLGQADQRQAVATMTPADRRKWKRDKARTRATYDLPQALLDAVDQIGKAESMTNSAAVAALLAQALCMLQAGRWTLEAVKTFTRSPLFEYLVTDETVEAILAGKVSLEV
jgi:ABC-type branched-subunit amino acid transport system substrate-binding protein